MQKACKVGNHTKFEQWQAGPPSMCTVAKVTATTSAKHTSRFHVLEPFLPAQMNSQFARLHCRRDKEDSRYIFTFPILPRLCSCDAVP